MTLLAGALLCFVLPGLAGGTLLTSWVAVPDRPGLLLTRSLTCGVSVWFLTSALLMHTVGLTATSSWVATGLVGATSVAVLIAPRSRAVLRRSLPEAAYAGALALVTLLCWLPVALVVVRTTWGPVASTAWYYWGLAEQVAALGHLPDTVTEWGTQLPFLADYQLFTSGTAMLLLEADGQPVRALQVVIVTSVLLLGCGSSLLALRLGAGRVASLAAAPFAVATGLGAIRLTSYRPEAFALGLVFLVAVLFADWFRHRDRVSLVLGCVLGAVLAQVHGIALATAGMLLVGVVAAFLPRHDKGRYLRDAALTGLALVLSVGVLGVLLGGVSGAEHTGKLADTSGVDDLTWDFSRAITGRPPSLPQSNPSMIAQSLRAVLLGGSTWVVPVLVVALLVLVVAARHQAVARRVLVFTLVSLAGIVVAVSVFALGWQSYVPRRVGAQRLVREASLLVGPVVACALASVPWARARPPVLGAAVGLVCLGAVLSSTRTAETAARQRPDPDDLAALAEVGIGHGDVVLTNGYVEGYPERVTGGTGLLDGRAPFTYPDVLVRADGLLRKAKEFFARPRQNREILEDNGVDYIVVGNRKTYSLGTDNVFSGPLRRNKLDRSPALELVLQRPGLRVYRVLDVDDWRKGAG